MLPREKKASTPPHWGKMRNDLLIICGSFDSFDAIDCCDSSPVMLQISRKLIQIWTTGGYSWTLFHRMNINTSLIIFVFFFFGTGPGELRMFTYQVLNGTDISCCGAFVIVCVPFLPVTVKPISPGGTVKMTLDVFSEVNRRCQGKISFIVMFQVYTRILTWKPVRCFPRHVFSTNSRATTFIAVFTT